MSEEELKCWFFNKLNSCYQVKNIDFPDRIIWVYDESHIRKIKLCKLSNVKFKLPNKLSGVCLFEQDLNNNILYCDYYSIWNIIYMNTGYKLSNIRILVMSWLEHTKNLNEYTPYGNIHTSSNNLKEIHKFIFL